MAEPAENARDRAPTPSGVDALNPIAGAGPLMTDRVEDILRAAILDGTLASGAHLSVPALARRLQTSRTPAREALFRLEREGLVQVTPHRGAVVLRGGRDDFDQLFELREPLEGMAARLAADRMDDVELDRLAQLIARHRDAVASHDLEAHLEADLAFHNLVRHGARNGRLSDSLERIERQIRVVIRAGASRPGGMPQTVIAAHSAIAAAITERAPDRADYVARSHVRAVGELLSVLLFD